MDGFIVIGDTHGNFKYIRGIIKNRDIKDTTFLHVGDFGVGFKTVAADKVELKRLNTRLEKNNCHMYVIRGNHDNPAYFDGTWDFGNLHLIPDYTVLTVNGDDILMVGGAVSVDRVPRKEDERKLKKNNATWTTLYYPDEKFVLDVPRLKEIKGVRYVVTHTCPKWVTPINNVGVPTHGYLVDSFAAFDPTLKAELDVEREEVAQMYEILKENNLIEKWFYGHFHRTNAEYYEETDFVMLGINEFREVIQG